MLQAQQREKPSDVRAPEADGDRVGLSGRAEQRNRQAEAQFIVVMLTALLFLLPLTGLLFQPDWQGYLPLPVVWLFGSWICAILASLLVSRRFRRMGDQESERNPDPENQKSGSPTTEREDSQPASRSRNDLC